MDYTTYVNDIIGDMLRSIHHTAMPYITRTFGVKPPELAQWQTLYADSTDYLLGGNIVMKNGRMDKCLFEGGYAQAISTGANTDRFVFYYYNKDHLGNNRELMDIKGRSHQVTNYYPFGAPYADPTAISGDNNQPYKYNGKELDKMHGLNTYDYGARQYYSILGRWDRIDPLCEKYYSISPYIYCAENPVRLVDPYGMEFTDISWQYLNMLLQYIDNKINHYQNKIQEKQQIIDSGKYSGKKNDKYMKQIAKYKSKIEKMDEVVLEINALNESNQVYNVERSNRFNTDDDENSGAYFNPFTNQFDIVLGGNSLGMMAHELKHAYQFETGAYSTTKKGTEDAVLGIPFYDQYDEIEAYERGKMFGGPSYSSLPVIYSKFQKGPVDYTCYKKYSSNWQRLADEKECAFRVNGKTYSGISIR